jgi:glycosyltransferase involved in cell wall biosynthesis
MYDVAARAASLRISETDPELRVTLCRGQDALLDRIADFSPELNVRKPFGVYTPSIYESHGHWGNTSLLMCFLLAGYMIARHIGARCVAYFGTRPADYPLLSGLPGMEILYKEFADGTGEAEEVYYSHLAASARDMDMIILTGIYQQTFQYLHEYRKYRPDGKVYCALDMNSSWMNVIPWDNVGVKYFMSQCDLLTVECRSLRDALNRNPLIASPCYWRTNGFYNPTDAETTADPKAKENVILTVSRIGTQQKNNEELLAAFSLVADALPGWSVRLVGPVDPQFQPFINAYFELRPDLKERVILTGAIADKKELYKEYARAKVFALTSLVESIPNVYAEALLHGCMFITSDIDAADDIVNYGELGCVYNRGDVNGLASVMKKICTNADETAFKRHIPKALRYAARYFDWNRNAIKLAYMLFHKK